MADYGTADFTGACCRRATRAALLSRSRRVRVAQCLRRKLQAFWTAFGQHRRSWRCLRPSPCMTTRPAAAFCWTTLTFSAPQRGQVTRTLCGCCCWATTPLPATRRPRRLLHGPSEATPAPSRSRRPAGATARRPTRRRRASARLPRRVAPLAAWAPVAGSPVAPLHASDAACAPTHAPAPPAMQKSERRYWTEDERAKFHAAMRQCAPAAAAKPRCLCSCCSRRRRRHGTDFNEISKFVGTRTSTQVRTHVQKYHLKLVRAAALRATNAASTSRAISPVSTSADARVARYQVREYQASKRKAASEAAAAAAEDDVAQTLARF